jgi:hypothetical protein
MTDKITRLPTRPRLAVCTGEVPSENPDRFKSDNLRMPGMAVRPDMVLVPVEELQAMRVMAIRVIHFIDCRLEHWEGDAS